MTDPTHPTPAPDGVPVPPGARLLTPDEAAHLIVTGDHSDSQNGSALFDAALIGLIRDGQIRAAQLPDGTLAFAVVPDTA